MEDPGRCKKVRGKYFMMTENKNTVFAGIICLAVAVYLFTSCESLVDYSIFDADIDAEMLNHSAISKIPPVEGPLPDTLRFAVFSDVHDNYDEMAAAITSINRQPGLKYVICGGDITNSGLTKEFRWYADIMKRSHYPLITLIGNHDHLANGLMIYEKLFGNPNASFVYGQYKFVLFNNTMLENYNKSPRYQWLRDELPDNDYTNILISHIPPFADEIDDLNRMVLNTITSSGNVKLCIHGHLHKFRETEYNGIHTVVAGDISDREYYVVKLKDDRALVEIVKF